MNKIRLPTKLYTTQDGIHNEALRIFFVARKIPLLLREFVIKVEVRV